MMGPSKTDTGFTLAADDVLRYGEVTKSLGILRELLALRGLPSTRGAPQDLDAVLRQEVRRLMATGAQAPEEARAKRRFVLTDLDHAGLEFSGRALAMIVTVLRLERAFFETTMLDEAKVIRPP